MICYQNQSSVFKVSNNLTQNSPRLLIRSVFTGPCLHTRNDVYIQKISKRFAEPVCDFPNFPLQMDPSCRVAIITGGETGIGLAAANDLLKNGAQVVVLAGVCEGEAVVKQLTEEHGTGRVCFMHMDVNDPRDFEELFYRVDLVFGGVDIVFNNAGILQDHVWEYAIDTNLKSVLRGTILGLDYMGKKGKGKRRGQGVIINHSDVAALDGFPYAPAYVASKAGILGATLSFGSKYHYNSTGVRVVGLLSGPTNTNMISNAAEKQLSPEMGKATFTALSEAGPQSPEVVGKAVTYMVKYAPPGSLWTVEKGELLLTKIPDRRTFSRKVREKPKVHVKVSLGYHTADKFKMIQSKASDDNFGWCS